MRSGTHNWLGISLRVGLYAVLSYLGLKVFAWFLFQFSPNLLLVSAFSVFLAAAASNALAMRIWEHARLTDAGFAWTGASVRNLFLGLGGGAGAAVLVLVPPLIGPAAEFQAAPGAQAEWSALLFFTAMILFGAAGEEMLFRGYGFQVLLAAIGPFATILPIGILFSLAHLGNLNISPLGALNTFGWGVLLGYAFWRSGDLWMPIGLHAGWNWALPLFGTNLSGFTMNVTGYAVRWNVGPFWSGGEYGPEGGILTSGVLVTLFVFLRKAPVRRQAPLLLRPREEA